MSRAWLLPILCALAACASTQRSLPVPYDIYLDVDAGVNPNEGGQPSPILVGIYELTSDDAFRNADFSAVQDHPKEALGEDLVSVQQLILYPGEHRVISHAGSERAHRLGVVAGYRRLDAAHWRDAYPLPGNKSTNLYKFWQSTPRRKYIRIDVKADGLAVRRVR